MSGSSLDGLDLAICRFDLIDEHSNLTLKHWEFLKTKAVSFSSEWRKKISPSFPMDAIKYNHLHYEFGRYLGDEINNFVKEANLKIDFIASHGHTLYHDPSNHFSLQIGDGASISSVTGLPVISDFRNGDMALGGQGAPLAPLADQYLLPVHNFYLNIGGIANITFINKENRIAFDVCPANQLLNHVANQLGLAYDDKGQLAKSGSVDNKLLLALNSNDYYQTAPPKSLDNNWINENVIPLFKLSKASKADQLCTAVHFICKEIAKQVATLSNSKKPTSLIACGGGAKNDFLMEQLKIEIETLGIDIGINNASEELIDFKEAALIALMGAFRILGTKNIYSSVTGASIDNCGGAIYDSHAKLKSNG
jgi:anhydro-N-acetylmuramic acid kinase